MLEAGIDEVATVVTEAWARSRKACPVVGRT